MRAALLRDDYVENVIEVGEDFDPGEDYLLVELADDSAVSTGWTREGAEFRPPAPAGDPAPPPFASTDWATQAQAQLDAQRQILDLLLLGGLDDDGGTIDGAIGADLPDSGGTLDDLDGLDLGNLPDSGETIDDLALEG